MTPLYDHVSWTTLVTPTRFSNTTVTTQAITNTTTTHVPMARLLVDGAHKSRASSQGSVVPITAAITNTTTTHVPMARLLVDGAHKSHVSSRASSQGSVVPITAATTNSSRRASSRQRRHLQWGEIRGVRSLFDSYFKPVIINGKKKRLSKAEKNSRFASYKQRCEADYNRIVKGTFESERAFIKRYSDPLYFIKYRLKRSNDLTVSDLTAEEYIYYKEIGGVDDVTELIRKQQNIDSLTKVSRRLIGPPPKRQKLNDGTPNIIDVSASQYVFDNNNYRRNHNGVVSGAQIGEYTPTVTPMPNLSQTTDYPTGSQALSQSSRLKTDEKSAVMNTALNQLSDGLDIYEREKLEKKKSEAYQLAQQKFKAINATIKGTFIDSPELIGCIVSGGSLDDQREIAFDVWLSHFKSSIKTKVHDMRLFETQISLLKQDQQDWDVFSKRFKTHMILNGNSFQTTWEFIRDMLNVEEAPVIRNRGKEELDSELDEDDDIL
eukprot:822713_1